LPAVFQGTAFNAGKPIPHLARPASINPESETATHDFLRLLNERHLANHPGDADMSARIAGYGRIVAITSSAVKEPIPNLALSNAARAAATGYLKTLAREAGGEGITVNAVLPGRILTDRIRRLAMERAGAEGVSEEEALAQQAADVPLGRLGRPEDVGDVVTFLASERAAYLTGCMLSVDGGLLRSLF